MTNKAKILILSINLILLFSCKNNQDKLFDYISDKDYENLKIQISENRFQNLDFKNGQNQTPLFCAILKNDQTATEILIEHGADVNLRFGDTISITGLAILSENEKIIKSVLKNNKQINKPCFKDDTPLKYAVKTDNLKLVSQLLSNKADINLPDTTGNTPIFYSETPEMLALLIKKNAKTTIENKNGNTVKQFITSKKVLDYFNAKITFDLFKVKGAKSLLWETSYKNSIKLIVKRYKMPIGGYLEGWNDGKFEKSYNYKIVCVSDTFNLIDSDYNPFIKAVELAYYQERPLTISPDMIWLLICQGFSQHIQQNAEKYRNKFVSFQGKKNIIINRNWGDFTNKSQWKSIINDFGNETKKYTKDSIYQVITSNFSTTTINEEIAFQITYLDVMKNYFNYIDFSCGIPSITLEGTQEDWEKIYNNADCFKQYDLSWWIDSIKPILKEFVETSKGNINKEFWKQILKINKNMYLEREITGWVNKFFPYVYDSVTDTITYRHNMIIVKNWCFTEDDNFKKKYHYGRTVLKQENILSGVCIVPFICKDEVSEYKLEFAAGFVGIKQDKSTKSLRPEIGWAILKK